ncbi:Myb-like_DNA-binding domain-containing protein [Hexamita inflata]|uniref:Myb-like DNA-binding domain-containing protein n=1 Tax=Hexamita inflata TaxID=28002 RepID=A0AA86TY44_9EUKA|nr:Myb-like DNA-binding domain-containing protein [Hexamita inflata]
MNHTYQRSDVSCVKWSRADVQLLIEAHAYHGNNWIHIRQHYFPNRSPNQVKCKHNYLVRKSQQSDAVKEMEANISTWPQIRSGDEISGLLNLSSYSFYQTE